MDVFLDDVDMEDFFKLPSSLNNSPISKPLPKSPKVLSPKFSARTKRNREEDPLSPKKFARQTPRTPSPIKSVLKAGLLTPKRLANHVRAVAKQLAKSSTIATAVGAEVDIHRPYIRCEVLSISNFSFDLESNCMSRRLIAILAKTEEEIEVILTDEWADCLIEVGDIINVIGNFNKSLSNERRCINVSSRENIMVLHPDTLLSCTSVSNIAQCLRKAALQDRVKSSTTSNQSLIYGNIIHEILQTCLIEDRWDRNFLHSTVEAAMLKNIIQLWEVQIPLYEAKEYLGKRLPDIERFSTKFVGQKPKIDAFVSDLRQEGKEAARVSISGIHAVEEDIWSHVYGLKGKIDVTVQASVAEPGRSNHLAASRTMPFEIKTGKKSGLLEHRAQTMLYTMLMQLKNDQAIADGLLYYSQSNSMIRAKTSRKEISGLISGRNRLASYHERKISSSDEILGNTQTTVEAHSESSHPSSLIRILPPTIDDAYACKNCYQVDSCMLYRAAVEDVKDDSSPIADLFEEKCGNLTSVHKAFFKHWERLLSLEESSSNNTKKELWTMQGAERERRGSCMTNMFLTKLQPKGNVEKCIFKRKLSSSGTTIAINSFELGDNVSISHEPDNLDILRGTIINLTAETWTIKFREPKNLESILRRISIQGASDLTDEIPFRIDKNESSFGLERTRYFLTQLVQNEQSRKLRNSIVDLIAPKFHTGALTDFCCPKLNSNQSAAIVKALSAEDYLLIHGMPGSGKTTTIVELVKILIERGHTVLLASYTHSAVDTILCKMIGCPFKILRLGSKAKCHPEVAHLALPDVIEASSLAELDEILLKPPLVATTCLGVNHPLFSRRKFDYCIIDEASQVTLPICIGPLQFANKFILVGDPLQLPPLVRSEDALKGGLQISLFNLLAERHPDSVCRLSLQYRMNSEIMALSNELVYGGKLQAGISLDRSLDLNAPKDLESYQRSSSWLKDVLSPSRKVVFVNTDQIPGVECLVGNRIYNPCEVAVTRLICKQLGNCGVDSNSIGVISPYRSQIRALCQELRDMPGIEVMTADKSQGRSKDCIILSLVRSNKRQIIGELLQDWRRLNVSLTRSKYKLVIVGSRSTLENSTENFRRMFQLIDENQWSVSLPPNEHFETENLSLP